MTGQPTSLGGLRELAGRGWTLFRRLPVWAQGVVWALVWPALVALLLARTDRLGIGGPALAAVALLIGWAGWWSLPFSSDTQETSQTAQAEDDGDPTEGAPSEAPESDASSAGAQRDEAAAATATEPDDAEPSEPDAAGEVEESRDPDGEADTAAVTGELEVHFLDVGQGDATLLISDDATLLIDTGRHNASDVVAHLDARGVDALDLVAVTHPHADHLGQFDLVMDAFDVSEVWWSGATHTSQNFDAALAALEASDAAYEEPRAGDSATVGQLLVEVVNPPPSANFSDLHDSGLAFRVTFGDVAFLFTGDAEASTEARMVSDHADWLAADIYQVGHHGSDTSTTQAFLDAVGPSIAVYSASATNQYGHPHDEILNRLDAAGVDVYGTDVHGSVLITTDGTDWTVETDTDADLVFADRVSGGEDESSAQSGAEPEEEGDHSAEGDTGTSGGCESGQVDINSASVEELQRIHQIGPERAEQIVALRPFSSVSQLTRVSGIAEGRLREIEEEGLACVG